MAASAAHGGDDAWEPSLLSLKGFQSWSVGCRAPAICEMFVGFTRKKLSKLLNVPANQKKRRTGKRTEGAFGSEQGIPQTMPRHSNTARGAAAPMQWRTASLEERLGRKSCVPRRRSDASASNLDCLAMLRRNPDASASASDGYQRVWVNMEEGGTHVKTTMGLAREVKLGGRRSEAWSGGVCAHRRSFCGSEGLGDRRKEAEEQRQQLLLATHISVAPVPTPRLPVPRAWPSGGLLAVGDTVDLKDRIILFL